MLGDDDNDVDVDDDDEHSAYTEGKQICGSSGTCPTPLPTLYFIIQCALCYCY